MNSFWSHIQGDKVAEMLLKSGAEPNWPREDGETSVHVAARYGYVDTFKLLLEEGGDVLLQSKVYLTTPRLKIKLFYIYID